MLTDAERLDQVFALLEELAPHDIALPDRASDSAWPDPARPDGRHYRALLAASAAAVLLAAGIAYQTGRSPGGRDATTTAQTSSSQRAPVGPTPPGQIIPVRQRETAGDFTVPSFTQQHGALRLSRLRGKVVVLSYWAGWCAPCREEVPVLARYATAHSGRGVVMAGINEGELSAGASTQLLKLPLAYGFYLDRNGVTGTRLGLSLRALPVTVVIDRHGRVAAKYAGAITTRTLQTVLPPLLAEH